MGNTYTPVPAEKIEELLESKGFARTIQNREVVYEYPHKIWPAVKVRVFTSIRIGDAAVRRRGKDSIKVCTVYESSKRKFGIGKFPHIFRVGEVDDILNRILERSRLAYARGTEWIRDRQVRQVFES